MSFLVPAVRILLTGAAFVLFWTGGSILALLLPPLSRLAGGTRWRRARRCQAVVRESFRLFHGYMRVVRLIHYEPTKVKPLPISGPCVLVSNHPSLVDVTAIVAAYGQLCCVAKHVYFRNPFIVHLLRCCEHIDGGDNSAPSGILAVQGALERLAAGLPVLVFPEGTRSPDGSGSLLPFRRGAFEIACRAGVPIIPLLMRCDPPTLLKHQRWYQTAGRAVFRLTLEPLEPILPADFAAGSTALAQRCESLYRERLGIGAGPAAPPARQSADLRKPELATNTDG